MLLQDGVPTHLYVASGVNLTGGDGTYSCVLRIEDSREPQAPDTSANERYVLRYDTPAKDVLAAKQKGKAKGLGYIQTALPLGNGRLGAMFSGGIETEHLLINDITLWMNAKRGMDEVAQSGTRIGAHENLETVRQAYRDGKYGTKPGSMESLSTEYLSSKERLGNYAPFTDVLISTEHDPASARDYRRSLDSRTGLGTVSYSIGKGKFKTRILL